MFRPGFLILAVIVAACNAGNDFGAKAKEAEATEKYSTNSGGAEPTAEGADATTVDTIESTQAVTPIVIAGASLTCVMASDNDHLACRVPVGNNKFYQTNPAHRLEWNGLTATQSFPITDVQSYDGVLAGTQFFVPIVKKPLRAITVRIIEANAVQTLTFALKDLPFVDQVYKTQSFPVANFPSVAPGFSQLYFMNGARLGDGKVSNEEDACLGTNDIALGNGFSSNSFTINLPGPKMDIYIDGTCGLQNPWSYISIDLPAPQKPLRVSLTPYVGKALLFRNVEVPAGRFNYRLGYEPEYEGSADLDDFSVSSLVMIKI
ncbi:MAG: hypothetical protein EOP07_10555 [Proteobacteria bacterium]|nr:MAG: hypothetical protein EOP07_10555 [Pseudomonadota bacterium]